MKNINNYIKVNAVIIGAGPVGLFQAFELGLLEIQSHIIDSLPKIGGQCIELYPDKPIYDIPGIPVCTGKKLINNLMKQINPFNPIFYLNQEVIDIKKNIHNEFIVKTSLNKKFITKTVFIAAGVGSFKKRKLKIKNIKKFENSQLFYSIKNPELFKDKNIVICGGGDSALDWTLYFINKVKSITLIHHSSKFRANPSSVNKMNQLCKEYKMQFITGQIIDYEENNNKLTIIKIINNDNIVRKLSLDVLLIFFGLSPKLGKINNWGLNIYKKQIKVINTEKFETNIPGIFAIGDINIYPGKKKLILSGFHEAALAAFASVNYIYPKKKINMQYTTTSTKLHNLLKIKK